MEHLLEEALCDLAEVERARRALLRTRQHEGGHACGDGRSKHTQQVEHEAHTRRSRHLAAALECRPARHARVSWFLERVHERGHLLEAYAQLDQLRERGVGRSRWRVERAELGEHHATCLRRAALTAEHGCESARRPFREQLARKVHAFCTQRLALSILCAGGLEWRW